MTEEEFVALRWQLDDPLPHRAFPSSTVRALLWEVDRLRGQVELLMEERTAEDITDRVTELP